MLGTAPPPPGRHGNGSPAPTAGSDVPPAEEAWEAAALLEASEEDERQLDGSWGDDGRLDRRWVLWQEFMTEHANLDAWLRLAERAVTSHSSAHITHVTAEEELRRLETLRREAGSRLVQLDGLTRRNQTLTRLFRGAVKARLLAAARESGRRWDDANARLETITARLKLFVSEWEEFEAERAELALWLAELDVRLTEVEQVTGNTCDKMRRLQSFQQCVCVNSGRVNALLRRGEALIQCSEPSDAQHVESHLLDLLRHCSHVYNNIARTHTRLLSMRLVFEDDSILSQAPDSGCPSETVLEEDGVFEKSHLDVSAPPTRPHDFSQSAATAPAIPSSPDRLPPPPPSPTHEHLGLEWDPSVDIGRSVSRDDADSSYFSASAGLCYRDGLKRRSYLSSQSDISNDIINQEADWRLDGWFDHAQPRVFSPITPQEGGAQVSRDQWATSTPDGQDCEPFGFDGGRVRAWLGVQSHAPLERRTSCSRSVQTDGQMCKEKSHTQPQPTDIQRHHDDKQLWSGPSHPLPHDRKGSSDWTRRRRQSNLQSAEDEQPPSHPRDEDEQVRRQDVRVSSEERVTSSRGGLSSRPSPAVLSLLLAAALALLAWLMWSVREPSCHRSNGMLRSFHVTLRYVNGPPPT